MKKLGLVDNKMYDNILLLLVQVLILIFSTYIPCQVLYINVNLHRKHKLANECQSPLGSTKAINLLTHYNVIHIIVLTL